MQPEHIEGDELSARIWHDGMEMDLGKEIDVIEFLLAAESLGLLHHSRENSTSLDWEWLSADQLFSRAVIST